MYFIQAYCFERVQVRCISAWVLDLWACFTADLLWGRGLVSNFGSLAVAELPVVMAFFASWSAASFPLTSLCAGTHLI